MGGARSEGDPQAKRPLIRRLGERIGLFVSSEKQAEIDRQNRLAAEAEERLAEGERRYNAYQERLIDALVCSTACTGKMEYLLGRIDVDPHPHEEVIYNPEHPFPGTYRSYLDSVWTQEEGSSLSPSNATIPPGHPQSSINP